LIDSHCHFDFKVFDHDRAEILANCASKGIQSIIVPGTQASRWLSQISLCKSSPSLYFALGLHPYFLDSFENADFTLLSDLLVQHRQSVVAIGEIGLDFAIDIDPVLQLSVFEQQLGMAKDFDLPVILHHRKSHQSIIKVLRKLRLTKAGVVHAFTGSIQEAQGYIDLGFKLGVGGSITYPRAVKTRKTFETIPIEAMVLETDAPDMPMFGRQGQRNQPDFLPQIVEVLCRLKQMSFEQVVAETSINAEQVFSLAKHE
jgi:TatD DNase family protein